MATRTKLRPLSRRCRRRAVRPSRRRSRRRDHGSILPPRWKPARRGEVGLGRSGAARERADRTVGGTGGACSWSGRGCTTTLRAGGPLPHIGKSALPKAVLGKRGPLTIVEWELVKEHPEMGATLVELAPGLAEIGRSSASTTSASTAAAIQRGRERKRFPPKLGSFPAATPGRQCEVSVPTPPQKPRARRGRSSSPGAERSSIRRCAGLLDVRRGDFAGAEKVLDDLSARPESRYPRSTRAPRSGSQFLLRRSST